MNTLHLGGLPARPMALVCLAAVAAFALGFALTVTGAYFPVFLLLLVIVLLLAGGSVGAVIRAIPGDDLDIEVVLFLIPSAVLGAVLFLLILGSYIAGVSLPYAVALVDWDEEAAEGDWTGWMIILLIGAGLLAVIVGAPVGIVAWASRHIGQGQR